MGAIISNLIGLATNGSFRRWGLGAVITAILIANRKLNFGLTETDIYALAALAIATITGSNIKEGQVAIAEAKVIGSELPKLPEAAPLIRTPEEAAAAVAKL